MARLVYSAICSLDGFVADAKGNFEWAAPDQEVHQFVNDVEREIGTYLYGRRMYEVMREWQTMDVSSAPAFGREYAEIWRGAEKIVYSRSLEEVSTPLTRLERDFDPDEVARFKENSSSDLSVGGPTLAAEAFRAGLVDDIHLFVVPDLVGGGTRAMQNGVRRSLRLESERRFANGTVHLHYRDAG
ncbi:MAG: dihydrofolate reductase family protein [Actinomycetota bacterium]